MPEQIGQVEWKGDEFLRDVERASRQGVRAAGAVVQASIRQRLGRQGAPTSLSGFRSLIRGIARLRSREDGEAVRDTKRGARDEAFAQSLIGGWVDPPGGSPRLRTGTLRRSIITQRDDSGTEYGVKIGSGVRYADIHEFGGTIVAKTAKALRFVIQSADLSRFVTVRSVKIPARPFIRPGFHQSKQAAFEAFVAEATRQLDKPGGGA